MRYVRGFTLVEMMITVAVLGILVAIAVPSFRNTIERNQVVTASNDLLSSLLVARSEAVKQERRINIKKYSGNWDNGWVVRINGVGGAPGLLLRHTTTHDDIAIVANKGANKLRYLAGGRGARNNANASLRPGTDYFELTLGDETRYICFSVTGRPRVEENICQ